MPFRLLIRLLSGFPQKVPTRLLRLFSGFPKKVPNRLFRLFSEFPQKVPNRLLWLFSELRPPNKVPNRLLRLFSEFPNCYPSFRLFSEFPIGFNGLYDIFVLCVFCSSFCFPREARPFRSLRCLRRDAKPFGRLLTSRIIDGTYLPEVLVLVVVVVFLQDWSRLFVFCCFYFIWSFSLSSLLHFFMHRDRRIMAEEGEWCMDNNRVWQECNTSVSMSAKFWKMSLLSRRL